MLRHVVNDRNEKTSRERLKDGLREWGFQEGVRGEIWGVVGGCAKEGEPVIHLLSAATIIETIYELIADGEHKSNVQIGKTAAMHVKIGYPVTHAGWA